MLDYEWGNPSVMMRSADEPNQEPDPNRQIFDHYATTTTTYQQSFNETIFFHHQPNTTTSFSHHQNYFHNPNQLQSQTHHYPHSLYDPRAYSVPSAYSTLDPGAGGNYFLVPKTEEVSRPVDFTARIGLNLGGRTYFTSAEDDFVNRLCRRSRPGDHCSTNTPRCQAEGCNADLTRTKHYHRRHKVCEYHSKASTVIAAGLTQRFCQQCSRFHILSEFDNGKRSCRKRLADHNRRRRKSQQQPSSSQGNQKPILLENGSNSSFDNPPGSPPDSGVQSSSSVSVSPPRMSLDCFRQRPNYSSTATASSSSSSTLFFASG